MELTIEDIPIIINVLPAKGDNKPHLIATIKDSDIVYSCSLYKWLSKTLEVTNNIYESLRKIIASKDTHLMSAKFTDNNYTTLKVETFYYLENSTLRFTSDCYANISAHFQLQPTIEKYKKAAANSSNSKLLELIEKLTERVAALEAQISEK